MPCGRRRNLAKVFGFLSGKRGLEVSGVFVCRVCVYDLDNVFTVQLLGETRVVVSMAHASVFVVAISGLRRCLWIIFDSHVFRTAYGFSRACVRTICGEQCVWRLLTKA